MEEQRLFSNLFDGSLIMGSIAKYGMVPQSLVSFFLSFSISFHLNEVGKKKSCKNQARSKQLLWNRVKSKIRNDG